jgi:hypothetical protein
MIMTRLMGGMGNQMFQYAFGKYLADKNQTALVFDTTLLDDRKNAPVDAVFRDYDLDIFNLSGRKATQPEIEYFNGKVSNNIIGKVSNRLKKVIKGNVLRIQQGHEFSEEQLEFPDNSCLVGRWQSEKYFNEIANQIRKEFSFKNPLGEKELVLAEEIQETASVCLNVRRADYVSNETYSQGLGFIGLDYYASAIQKLKETIGEFKLFVFSDDIEWCKDNFKFDVPYFFVSHDYKGKKFQFYLHLMTLCQHFIIPNSTFAWWAAWLASNPDKIVIAPKKWSNLPDFAPPHIIPENWISI